MVDCILPNIFRPAPGWYRDKKALNLIRPPPSMGDTQSCTYNGQIPPQRNVSRPDGLSTMATLELTKTGLILKSHSRRRWGLLDVKNVLWMNQFKTSCWNVQFIITKLNTSVLKPWVLKPWVPSQSVLSPYGLNPLQLRTLRVQHSTH